MFTYCYTVNTLPLGIPLRFQALHEINQHLHTFLQKPIMLHGHTRAITQIKYNREGDLLFSAAKDSTPNVWFSINGERLGTFKGHNGVVWSIDVNCILLCNILSV